MAKQLSFELKLSLEEMALRRAVVNLWSEADALASIENLRFELLPDREYGSEWQETIELKVKRSEGWRKTIEEVTTKVHQLALPESLKRRMVQIVRPIGSEMLRWRLLFHEAHLSDAREDSLMHLQQLCWTSAGSVDYKRTAEKLIHLHSIDLVKRYKLASLYCLEEGIKLIWKELPEEYRSGFNDLDHRSFNDTPTHLEFYWAYVLKGQEAKLDNFVSRTYVDVSSIHQFAFKSSARTGNKSAADYFFRKLSDEERESYLFRVVHFVTIRARDNGQRRDFPTEKLSEVLCYLLSVMTSEEKMQTIYKHRGDVLRCLLDWPWQDLFLDTADFIWTLHNEINNYYGVLHDISTKIKNIGYYFPKLIQEFYFRSPSDFRKLIASHFGSFFSHYSSDPDAETIQVIFRNADLEDKAKLVSSYDFSTLMSRLIARDEWQVVDVLLREVSVSKEDEERLKRKFSRLYSRAYYGDLLGGKMD